MASTHHFYRLLGDVNGDGTVDQNDLNEIAAARGQSVSQIATAINQPASGLTALSMDVNGDGSVNTTDLAWRRSPRAISCPWDRVRRWGNSTSQGRNVCYEGGARVGLTSRAQSMSEPAEIRTMLGTDQNVGRRAVAFSPDGQTIAVGECTIPPRDVVLMDVERLAPVRVRMTGHRYGCTSLAFSPTAATWRPPGAGATPASSSGIYRTRRSWPA